MLTVQDLHVNYGAVHALNGVSLTVNNGEIVSLIGANGAGKTTTLRTITGLEKAASGSITFDGVDLRKTEPSKIITHKLAHVPEGRHIFPAMTVEENLEWALTPTPPTWKRRGRKSTSGSPACGSGAASWRAPYRAASSRCWPWAAPS